MKKLKKILAVVLVLSSLVGFGASVTSFASESEKKGLSFLTHSKFDDSDSDDDPEPSYKLYKTAVVNGVKYYYSNNDEGICIEDGINPENELAENIETLEIPQFIDGNQVICISARISDGFKNLEKVIIPEGVKEINFISCSCKFVYLPTSLERGILTSFIFDKGNGARRFGNLVIPEDPENKDYYENLKKYLDRKGIAYCTPMEAKDVLEELQADETSSSFGDCIIM